MIDGWFMRKKVYVTKAFAYNGPNIRRYCKKHLRKNSYSFDDQIYRIFYYDTEPLLKKGQNPISKESIDFSKTPVAKQQMDLLESIKRTPNFALRLGRTVWRNNEWILNPHKFKELLSGKIKVCDLTSADVKPRIEQKAVDMKIGLDIAMIATKKLADVLIVITGDCDIVPALKLARIEGMMVGLDPLNHTVSSELTEHVDFVKTYIKREMFKTECSE